MSDTELILDLDGVFGDFAGAACVVHNHPTYEVTCWNFFEDWGMTAEEFWEPIRDLGNCFYNHVVQPYPWARELLAVCKKFDPNCVFASVAGGGHAADYSGKLLFVRKYFGDMPLIVLPGGTKQLLAAPGRVLIDDSDQEVSDWRGVGGYAITFPQPWNVARFSVNNRAEYVLEQLERITK